MGIGARLALEDTIFIIWSFGKLSGWRLSRAAGSLDSDPAGGLLEVGRGVDAARDTSSTMVTSMRMPASQRAQLLELLAAAPAARAAARRSARARRGDRRRGRYGDRAARRRRARWRG